MNTVTGFQIINSLYESDNSSVYRAIRHGDKQAVVLKVLKTEFPSPTQLARYQHEYELLSQLHLPNIIQAYGLERSQDHLVLILEDFGADSLNRWLSRRTFSLNEKLSLAIQMADSLSQLHSTQVIHKDINLNNIVWNGTVIKLIDFGIATLLPRETLALQNPNQLEGTLPYISPEQTGRMNRVLDYRTDLYSLGVTFYEWFAGRLPFNATDAMELVHCHLAKQPKPPHQVNSEIPLVLSHLILRLMAKAAEERYQSALGVKADLIAIQQGLASSTDLSHFQLGQQDFSDRFQLPQKLYGRETEVQRLLTSFAQVTTGQSQLLLVAGYSGIGKSILVQEVHKPITEKRGYFISGKFDQFQCNVPYSAVVHALRDLIRQLLTESQEQLDYWKNQLVTALGNNGQVIIDVINEVELIVGPQPVVPTLSPTESQNRFNLVFQNFIKVFCQPKHPLVLFLDDLQWIDSASLKLMSLMMSDIPYLLLIGAYRDNEVNATHPLMLNIEEILKQGCLVKTLTLTPLNLLHINQLVSDTLHASLEHTLPLAQLVLEKTGGNPFFLGEFLKTLYVEQLLKFNAEQHIWQWELAKIQAHNITDNVLDLMRCKIERLPTETQIILQLAASIGDLFDLNTLTLLSQHTEHAEVKNVLWSALVEGIIISISNRYKFIHDRVQQATYLMIPKMQRPQLHWKIGWILLTHNGGIENISRLEEYIFEITEHFNAGQQQAHTHDDYHVLVKLNVLAAKKARQASAFETALKYLTVATKYLDQHAWETDYNFTAKLYSFYAEAEFLNGNFAKSEEVITLLLEKLNTKLERAEIRLLFIIQKTMEAKYQEAIELGKDALIHLGLAFPTEDELSEHIQQILVEIRQNLGERDINSLLHLPENHDPICKMVIKILIALEPVVYIVGHLNLYTYVSTKTVALSLQYGNIAESAKGYSNYGIIVGSGLGDFQTGYQFGQLALSVSRQFSSQAQECKVCLLLGSWIAPWYQPLQHAKQYNLNGYQVGMATGEVQFASYNIFGYIVNRWIEGSHLDEIQTDIVNYLPIINRTKNDLTTDTVLGVALNIALLLELPQSITRYTTTLTEAEYCQYCLASPLGYTTYCILKAQTFYLLDDYNSALQFIERAKPFIGSVFGFVVSFEYNFYQSLILLALYQQSSATQQENYLTQITNNQAQLKKWADSCPINFLHKWLLIEAELAQIKQQHFQAINLYNQAIEQIETNLFPQNKALINERLSLFWLTHHQEKYAHMHLVAAHYHYKIWGAITKIKQLEKQYPHWLAPHRTIPETITHTAKTVTQLNSTRFTTSTDWLDLTSVMKAAQTLSDEIILENLLTKVMRTVLENAGAQRGVLILEQQGQWVIQAEMITQPETIVVLQSLPLEGQIPVTLLNYVIRTKQSLIFADIQREPHYQTDNYVRTHALKSVLALTLLHQQKLVGIIYLENNLTIGAFSQDRFQVLTLLSSQMAISLDNARFVKELQQAQRAAEAANQAKTAFLANVSHELRTPLNGILGYAQLLQQTPLTDKQQEFVKAVYRSGEHLLLMVSDILDISKLHTGRLTLQLADVNLTQLLIDIVGWFREQAQEKGLTFNYEFSSHLPVGIVADAKQLRQILMQLLTNAIKFTPQGNITLKVHSTPLAEQLGWHHFEFMIKDTGIGIAEIDLTKLFIPFEQVNDWLHKSSGAGLGLSLTKQLVELMGGHIQVESQLAQGTCFIISLDLAQSQEWQSSNAMISMPSVSSEIIDSKDKIMLKGPTAEQATVLYELAQIGDFLEIQKLMSQLEEEDEELFPFITKVRQWAKEFQDIPIEELAKQFMESSE